MTDLKSIGVTPKKAKQFAAKGINCVEDLLMFFPRKYNDFSQITGLRPSNEYSVFLAHVNSVPPININGRVPTVTALCTDVETNANVRVTWFGQTYIMPQVYSCLNCRVLIAGKAVYNQQFHNYTIISPEIFTTDIEGALRIYPVYSKIQNMSSDYLNNKIYSALSTPNIVQDPLPATIVAQEGLMSIDEAISQIHGPSSTTDLSNAQERLAFDELIRFAVEKEKRTRQASPGTIYNLKTLRTVKEAISNLPYQLTDDQQKACNDIFNVMRSGRRTQAMLFGDVGSGKSIVAYLTMLGIAESGYQAVLLAPTQALALQHYHDLMQICEPLGIDVLLVNGIPSRKTEKKNLIESLNKGSVSLIVGTHSLLNDSITFRDLAYVVVDEEQRFGVMQRQALLSRAKAGVHYLSMSATPIPRSLAQVMYGNDTMLCELKTMPNGRLPIKTAITKNHNAVYSFLERELSNGRQAYVVCPLIDKSEKVNDVLSCEETYEKYLSEFAEPKGFSIDCLTGRASKDEMSEILARFKSGETQILVCTTILEVGVNVPNASAMIIQNAERFGLATLHQLRGRVGRGTFQSFCVLFSTEKDNPRLQAMVRTTNGYEIAKEDLRIRGAGDFLGTAQSGDNKILALMLAYPKRYKRICEIASQLVDDGIDICNTMSL